jgi:hypothetical protein
LLEEGGHQHSLVCGVIPVFQMPATLFASASSLLTQLERSTNIHVRGLSIQLGVVVHMSNPSYSGGLRGSWSKADPRQKHEMLFEK